MCVNDRPSVIELAVVSGKGATRLYKFYTGFWYTNDCNGGSVLW